MTERLTISFENKNIFSRSNIGKEIMKKKQ